MHFQQRQSGAFGPRPCYGFPLFGHQSGQTLVGCRLARINDRLCSRQKGEVPLLPLGIGGGRTREG